MTVDCAELRDDIKRLVAAQDELRRRVDFVNEEGRGLRAASEKAEKAADITNGLLEKYLPDFAEHNPEVFESKCQLGRQEKNLGPLVHNFTSLGDNRIIYNDSTYGSLLIYDRNTGEITELGEKLDMYIDKMCRLSDDKVLVTDKWQLTVCNPNTGEMNNLGNISDKYGLPPGAKITFLDRISDDEFFMAASFDAYGERGTKFGIYSEQGLVFDGNTGNDLAAFSRISDDEIMFDGGGSKVFIVNLKTHEMQLSESINDFRLSMPDCGIRLDKARIAIGSNDGCGVLDVATGQVEKIPGSKNLIARGAMWLSERDILFWGDAFEDTPEIRLYNAATGEMRGVSESEDFASTDIVKTSDGKLLMCGYSTLDDTYEVRRLMYYPDVSVEALARDLGRIAAKGE